MQRAAVTADMSCKGLLLMQTCHAKGCCYCRHVMQRAAVTADMSCKWLLLLQTCHAKGSCYCRHMSHKGLLLLQTCHAKGCCYCRHIMQRAVTADICHAKGCCYCRHVMQRAAITYSMVQSPSWEANWFAASQEIPRISPNPKVHYRTHKRPPPVSILGQPNLYVARWFP